jgi:hypothetical protein
MLVGSDSRSINVVVDYAANQLLSVASPGREVNVQEGVHLA